MYPCGNLSTENPWYFLVSCGDQRRATVGKAELSLNLQMSWFFVCCCCFWFSTTANITQTWPSQGLKTDLYLIGIHLKLCQKMPFNSKWNSLVPGNIHRVRCVGRWTLTLQYLMVPYYLYAIKIQTSDSHLNLLQYYTWVPIPLPSPAYILHLSLRTQGQNEHAQVHLDSVSFSRLGLAALEGLCPGRFF